MFVMPNIPLAQRNPYTIWFKYAKQNVNNFNRITMHYNMERLQPPVYIKHFNSV
jgi:hypothetical protein